MASAPNDDRKAELLGEIEAFDAHIFDCDGTLVDSMPAHYVAWCRVLAPYGVELPEDRYYALGGMPTWQIVELLARESGTPLDPADILPAKERAFLDVCTAVQPVEPVVAIASACRGVRPLAVATGSRRVIATRELDHLGILSWFEGLVCADDVERGKPHPETYLRAAALVGVDPARCRAYEDTDLGAQSARDAGMDVVDIRALRT